MQPVGAADRQSKAGDKCKCKGFLFVGHCKHLSIDPFGYLRDALAGLFALGENPTAEHLLDWLPDRWLLNRTPGTPARPGAAG